MSHVEEAMKKRLKPGAARAEMTAAPASGQDATGPIMIGPGNRAWN